MSASTQCSSNTIPTIEMETLHDEHPPIHAYYTEKVASRYIVHDVIGSGTYSHVYAGTDSLTGQPVAIKLAHGDQPDALSQERMCYERLWRGQSVLDGIPRVFYGGEYEERQVMVMERLGESVCDLMERNGGRLNLEVVVRIGVQMVERLEFMHECGWIHRDVKPENMMVGADGCTVYLVDMGLATEFVEGGRHVSFREGLEEFHGTADYASRNAHRLVTLSRRDDLESLAYALAHMWRGVLPWFCVEEDDPVAQIWKVGEVKMGGGWEMGGLGRFLECVWGLGFEERPDYAYLKEVLRGEMGSVDGGEMELEWE